MQLRIRPLIAPALLLTGFAFLQTLALLPLTQTGFWLLLPDSLLHSLGCGLLALPLLNVVRFSRLHALPSTLRIINYGIYVLVATAVAVGSAYLIGIVVFGTEEASYFQPLLPVRALMNAFIFTGILLCVKMKPEEDETVHDKLADEAVTLTEQSYIERIALRSGTKIHVVLVEEVLYLQADGDYVQVVTPQGCFLKEQTLKSFTEQLPPEQFVRVHRSYLVNVSAISRIERYEKNTQQLRLSNGDTLKVSQQGYKLLRQQLQL